MKRSMLVAAILFLAAMASSAATLTVTWADGDVQVQKGSAWVAVGLGDNWTPPRPFGSPRGPWWSSRTGSARSR